MLQTFRYGHVTGGWSRDRIVLWVCICFYAETVTNRLAGVDPTQHRSVCMRMCDCVTTSLLINVICVTQTVFEKMHETISEKDVVTSQFTLPVWVCVCLHVCVCSEGTQVDSKWIYRAQFCLYRCLCVCVCMCVCFYFICWRVCIDNVSKWSDPVCTTSVCERNIPSKDSSSQRYISVLVTNLSNLSVIYHHSLFFATIAATCTPRYLLGLCHIRV